MNAAIHEVLTEDGVRIHVRESGPPDGPDVVFVHGWSQSWLSWRRQLEDSELAETLHMVAYDIRGHGASEAPPQESAYTAEMWAAELSAVIAQRELRRPVLVGWSFGGYVVCDYLRAYGQADVSGVNFVDWAVMLGNSERERRLAGPGFHDYFEDSISDDPAVSIAAMRGFVRACHAHELPAEDLETVLCFNAMVSPFVRRVTTNRPTLDNTDLLAGLTVPVLVTQGLQDRVTRVEAAEHILAHCPTARASYYDGAGHMPFLEFPDRFNRELADFVSEIAERDRA